MFIQVQWFAECDQIQSERPVEGIEGSGCHVPGARGDGKFTVQQPSAIYVGWKGKNNKKRFVLKISTTSVPTYIFSLCSSENFKLKVHPDKKLINNLQYNTCH